MSEAKHTPGPWKAEPATRSGAHHHITVTGTHGCYVIFLEQIEGNGCTEDFNANARLIAAAPTVLTLLRQAVDALDAARLVGHNPPQGLVEDIRAEIAKATGESA